MKVWCSRLFILIASAWLLLAAAGQAKEPVFPVYNGFVNDYAGVIDQAAKSRIESVCRELAQKTSAEMAVAVVKSAAPLDPKSYATGLFQKWAIGKKGQDNGLLILLVMDERRVEIEVGYGLEGVINDAKAGQLLDEAVIPFFKQGKYGEGLYNGVTAIAAEISRDNSSEPAAPVQPPGPAGNNWPGWLYPLVVVSVVILLILAFAISGLMAGLMGGIFGGIYGYYYAGTAGAVIGAIIGFVLSYMRLPGGFGGGYWGGGWGGGLGGGGGFGGFGGGRSGGGGAGRNW